MTDLLGLSDMVIFVITKCFLILFDVDNYHDDFFKSIDLILVLLGPQRNQKSYFFYIYC